MVRLGPSTGTLVASSGTTLVVVRDYRTYLSDLITATLCVGPTERTVKQPTGAPTAADQPIDPTPPVEPPLSITPWLSLPKNEEGSDRMTPIPPKVLGHPAHAHQRTTTTTPTSTTTQGTTEPNIGVRPEVVTLYELPEPKVDPYSFWFMGNSTPYEVTMNQWKQQWGRTGLEVHAGGRVLWGGRVPILLNLGSPAGCRSRGLATTWSPQGVLLTTPNASYQEAHNLNSFPTPSTVGNDANRASSDAHGPSATTTAVALTESCA